jgi:protein-S-isoprenylcysteine O-methyltransferase Ste14
MIINSPSGKGSSFFCSTNECLFVPSFRHRYTNTFSCYLFRIYVATFIFFCVAGLFQLEAAYEEKLLQDKFSSYAAYNKAAGIFLPGIKSLMKIIA